MAITVKLKIMHNLTKATKASAVTALLTCSGALKIWTMSKATTCSACPALFASVPFKLVHINMVPSRLKDIFALVPLQLALVPRNISSTPRQHLLWPKKIKIQTLYNIHDIYTCTCYFRSKLTEI